MIRLSDRLQVIANEICKGETVADIGTDHGLLPIFLYEHEISPRVILCDVNPGPLKKAEHNIEMFQAEGLTDLRLGDGLNSIKAGEVDTVVIAGMGGLLISDILSYDIEKSRSMKKFILQPRNAAEKLRAWLIENEFSITDEHLVREGKYLCEIITAMPWGKNESDQYDEIRLDYEISPILFAKKERLLIPFLKNKIRIESNVIRAINEGKGETEHERIQLAENRILMFKEKLQKIEREEE